MGVDFAKDYRSILQTDPRKKINVETNIEIEAPGVRQTFNAASRNDVTKPDLLKLVGGPDLSLMRNTITGDELSFSSEIRSLFHGLRAHNMKDAPSAEDKALVDQRIAELAKATGVEPAAVVEKYLRERSQELVADLRNIDMMSIDYFNMQRNFYEGLRDDIENMRTLTGWAFESDKAVYVLVSNIADSMEGSFLNEPPSPVPGTPDQMEFLIMLHEAEHTCKQGEREADSYPGNSYNDQINEIDADMAVMRYLNNAIKNKEPSAQAIKDRWLQERQINSFISGLADEQTTTPGDRYAHDTATFIRVFETKGNPQIDLQAFRGEKEGLMSLIKSRMKIDTLLFTNSKEDIEDVMGAVQDILKDKDLTEIQRREARSFMKDSKAVGYKPDANYPKFTPNVRSPEETPEIAVDLRVKAASPTSL